MTSELLEDGNSRETNIFLCMLGNFHTFSSSADFFQNHPFRKILSGIPSVSNSLDPDQARHFVGPDLGPNCLQRISVDDSSKQRANTY